MKERIKNDKSVTQCELRRIGTLDFDHEEVACSKVDDRKIYLCFHYENKKQLLIPLKILLRFESEINFPISKTFLIQMKSHIIWATTQHCIRR